MVVIVSSSICTSLCFLSLFCIRRRDRGIGAQLMWVARTCDGCRMWVSAHRCMGGMEIMVCFLDVKSGAGLYLALSLHVCEGKLAFVAHHNLIS